MIRFLHVQEVIDIHDRLIEEFGGCAGLRDLGLLVSAVEIPKSTMFGQWLHPTLFDQAAAYLFHISRNHPFVDGNKRTAAVSSLVFLEDNKISLQIDEKEFEDLVIQTSKGEISKETLSLFFSRNHFK